jgi:homoserine O-succinyltransferase
MPIKIPDNLPARAVLEREGIVMMAEAQAVRQDIRPIRIAILNLMPLKIATETQLTRLLGASPLQVEVTLLATASYTPRNTSAEHMTAFYRSWEEVRQQRFDGLIVTGAPVETLDYEDVAYWAELKDIFNWARENVYSRFFICWGAQAALYHYFGVPKHPLPQKAFGIYPHEVLDATSPLLRGFDDIVPVPVSRHTEVRRADIERVPGLQILVESEETGVCVVRDLKSGDHFNFNHLEYDCDTLALEYRRDVAEGKAIQLPHDYFPANDPARTPRNRWRSHAFLMFQNWLNEVYQGTPYDLSDLADPAGERWEAG